MTATQDNVLSIATLSDTGQLTLPSQYLSAWPHGETFNVMQAGAALLLVPRDEALATVLARMETALSHSGLKVNDLIAAADEARAEIVREQFGNLDEAEK
ncbi:MAG: hypothetical protein HYR56_23305 [Acidobacteria bacterium]|nr:hypothetical protein [Acidobacteriota bacterium]MBI3426118.1 hypothetical protein [Acidobacteriota bacterium]